MSTFPGLYRGLVEDAADPQQRKRYRVRVIGVHRDEVPVDALPWAELCCFAGKGFGDIPNFERGDAVFVMFEGGDKRFPIVFGGWLSYSGGTSDMPSEQTGDYERTSKRWTRIDRTGNKLQMSELSDEQGILLESGGVTLSVRGLDGTFQIQAESKVVVSGPVVDVRDAETVTVQSQTLTAQVTEEATLVCDGTVNVRAGETINVGQYTPPATTGLPPLPQTTAVVDVRADTTIKAESLGNVDVDAGTNVDIDAATDINVRCGANVLIKGDAKVRIESDGPVELVAKEVSVTTNDAKLAMTVKTDVEIEADGKVTVTGAQKVAIESENSDVAIAAAANVSVSADGNAEVSAQGNVTVEANGVARLSSASKVEIEAPVVEIAADSLLSMEGGSTVRVDGGVILLG